MIDIKDRANRIKMLHTILEAVLVELREEIKKDAE